MASLARAPMRLLPELVRVAIGRAVHPLRVWWRRTWLYRQFLKGPLVDRFSFYPFDPLPRRLEDADALLRGKFRFCGETVDAQDGSIFEKPAPTQAWAEALHGFAWLPPLAAAGGEPARALATNLIGQWLKRNGRYSEPAWAPAVMARRLGRLFTHGRIIVANSDLMWRSKVFVSLREQSRMLARIVDETPDGVARFEAAAVTALSGICLDQSTRRVEHGLALLEREIARQILPDGGHISRSPEALADAYRCLAMAVDGLNAMSREVPAFLLSAQDRMAPMLRFFRYGDGMLALFNGGREGDPRMVASLLSRDEVRGQPFGHARHSGYQRLAAGRTIVIADVGTPPPGPHSVHAHAGCLSFEFSSGPQRIVVNCGSPSSDHRRWESALRSTAAHSTLTLADTSSAGILAPGIARRLLGPRIVEGPQSIEMRRDDANGGLRLEARHDGYARAYGVVHERALVLAPRGEMLTGADRLFPSAKSARRPQSLPFILRFHIHPDVRISPSQGGNILLKLPNGEGWRFRAGGGAIAMEESVYLGGDTVRRTEQITISGAVKDVPVEVAWVFEQIRAGAD